MARLAALLLALPVAGACSAPEPAVPGARVAHLSWARGDGAALIPERGRSYLVVTSRDTLGRRLPRQESKIELSLREMQGTCDAGVPRSHREV